MSDEITRSIKLEIDAELPHMLSISSNVKRKPANFPAVPERFAEMQYRCAESACTLQGNHLFLMNTIGISGPEFDFMNGMEVPPFDAVEAIAIIENWPTPPADSYHYNTTSDLFSEFIVDLSDPERIINEDNEHCLYMYVDKFFDRKVHIGTKILLLSHQSGDIWCNIYRSKAEANRYLDRHRKSTCIPNEQDGWIVIQACSEMGNFIRNVKRIDRARKPLPKNYGVLNILPPSIS